MIRSVIAVLSVLAILIVGGCAATNVNGPPIADQREILALATEIRALGSDIDPEEAQRAAQIAFDYTHQLALAYQITDPPLIHNMKVNQGRRPRGLCWHWAEDMERRLKRENFQTLDMHRAIANADNPFRIDHSTAVVSRRGESMFQGVVLDPWRQGGTLHWALTREDTRYGWRPRAEVLNKKRLRLIERGELPAAG